MSQVAHIPARKPSIFMSWWFGDALLFALCGGILLLAVLMTPTDVAVSFFGFEIPMMCGFRRATGLECMGCGMTRSFAFMAHGSVVEAFSMNKGGPLLFALVATQPPYRLWELVRGWRRHRARAS